MDSSAAAAPAAQGICAEYDAASDELYQCREEVQDAIEEVKAATARLEAAKEAASEVENQLESIVSDESNLDVLLDRPTTWNEMYRKLITFKSENGHCNARRNNTKGNLSKEERSLGLFCGKNRKAARKERYHPDRIGIYEKAALDRIGFTFDLYFDHWTTMFEKLKKFKEDNGHLRVPLSDRKLYYWCRDQRAGKLAAERGEEAEGTREEEEKEEGDVEDEDHEQQQEEGQLEDTTSNTSGKRKRKRVVAILSKERMDLLDALGFDWRSTEEQRKAMDTANKARKIVRPSVNTVTASAPPAPPTNLPFPFPMALPVAPLVVPRPHTSSTGGGSGSKHGKKQKRMRDPNAPKRNIPAYLHYQNAMRQQLKKENPSLTFGQLAKYTSKKFKSLTPDEKAKWEKRAEEDKARYTAEIIKYAPPPGCDANGFLLPPPTYVVMPSCPMPPPNMVMAAPPFGTFSLVPSRLPPPNTSAESSSRMGKKKDSAPPSATANNNVNKLVPGDERKAPASNKKGEEKTDNDEADVLV